MHFEVLVVLLASHFLHLMASSVHSPLLLLMFSTMYNESVDLQYLQIVFLLKLDIKSKLIIILLCRPTLLSNQLVFILIFTVLCTVFTSLICLYDSFLFEELPPSSSWTRGFSHGVCRLLPSCCFFVYYFGNYAY